MNNQELISRLQETSLALEQLAQHLSAIEHPAAQNTSSDEAEENPENMPVEAKTETDSTIEELTATTEETKETEESEESESKAEMTDIIIETTFEAITEADEEKTDEKKITNQTSGAQNNNPTNNNPFAKIVSNLLNKPLPNANSMPGFNPLQMLTGGLSGMPGMSGLSGLSGLPGLSGLSGLNQQSLPTTLAELHDNPQLLGMIKNVSNNPQMLNMLAGLTGQDSQTLQQTLQSLQPNTTAGNTVNTAGAGAGAAVAANPTPNENIAAAPNNMFNPLTAAAPANASANPIANMPPMPSTPTNNLPATPYLDSLLAEWHWQPYARAWIF